MRCVFLHLKVDSNVLSKDKLDDKYIKNNKFSTDGDSCREGFASDIGSGLRGIRNREPESRYLKLSPYTKHSNDEYYGDCVLKIQLHGSRDMEKYHSNKEFTAILDKLLDYMLGISSVCLCNDVDGERKRRKNLHGNPNTLVKEHTETSYGDYVWFNYSVLSNFWLVSQITISLISSIFRDCVNAMVDDRVSPELDNLIFSKVDYDEVKRVINEVDKKKALDIYRKVIVPFYESQYVANSQSIPMSREKVRNAVDIMFREGTSSVFNPDKMMRYFDTFSHTYGVSKFCMYMNKINSRGAERYLRM